jgi:F-type H+-transporting ATPase subunit delta
MKVTKDAAAAGKRLYRLCAAGGKLDEDKLRTVFKALVARKPRNFKGILATLHRQVRLDLAQRHVTVESAKELDEATGQSITNKMITLHGEGLTFEYKINPALLGGIRIRKGDDVWDGSIKGRLDILANAF